MLLGRAKTALLNKKSWERSGIPVAPLQPPSGAEAGAVRMWERAQQQELTHGPATPVTMCHLLMKRLRSQLRERVLYWRPLTGGLQR